jgi:hypothetical protein
MFEAAPSRHTDTAPVLLTRRRTTYVLSVIVVLGLGAGAAWLWQARPGPLPPSDPWPKALAEVAMIVRDTVPSVERAADAARAAAEPMAFLDRTRPLLTYVDGWRTVSIRSRTQSSWAFETLGIPDNAYDGVLAALNLVAQGSGTAISRVESLARRSVGGRDALLAVAAELDATRDALHSFEQTPDRHGAEALAAYRTRFKERADPLLSNLSSWHDDVSRVARSVRSTRNAVRRAADTQIGRLVAAELSALENALVDVGAPLQQYDRRQAEVIRAMAETNVRLARIAAIVADARARDSSTDADPIEE